MDIRKAVESDAEKIHLLISAVVPSCQQDFGPKGLANFLAPNTSEKILERIQDEQYFSLLCEIENRLVGIISIKNYDVISQLFIHPDYQGKGIATNLWQEAFSIIKQNSQPAEITVRSSSMGVPVYESFGFKLSGKAGISGDIKYFPMTLSLNKKSSKSESLDGRNFPG